MAAVRSLMRRQNGDITTLYCCEADNDKELQWTLVGPSRYD